jgi:transglutaminase-like putative cysteine protease
LSSYAVPRDEALKAIEGADLDLAVDTLVKTGAISDAHRTRRIVYRVTMPDDDPAQYLSVGDTQSIERIAPDTVDLTVVALPAPQGASRITGKVEAEYLESNTHLQSDDKRVIALARAAAGNETDPWKVAVLMEKYVHDKLENKNFSTALASAAEVAEKLEGDCTEHACLLAAMARVYKIPSRIVVGLVYAPKLEAFGGHMWTEVFIDGKWRPLDATLGHGGIGAAHIKMGDSSFTDDKGTPVAAFLPLMNALGKMKIEVREKE